MTTLDRRSFLRRSAAAAAAGTVALGTPFQAYAQNVERGRSTRSRGYGPLREAEGGDLMLPEGFRYRIISRQDDPMDDGNPTPGIFDGMGAFPGPGGTTILIRNHENRSPFFPGFENEMPVLVDPRLEYDQNDLFKGGVTKLVLDRNRRVIESFAMLGGTSTNCAGGMTPWGTWITCEEIVTPFVADSIEVDGVSFPIPADVLAEVANAEPHGYIFEVDAYRNRPVKALPVTTAGQFFHEAVAYLAPYLYETEDNDIVNPQDAVAFYRYRPDQRPTGFGQLAARDSGRLEALAIQGERTKNLRGALPVGQPMPVRWVEIEEPNPQTDTVRQEAFNKGAAEFTRAEGIWVGDGRIYFDCTDGGEARLGQIFEYDPQRETLTLVYVSENRGQLEAPDNLTVAPATGDIFICEDGEAPQFVRGLTTDGRIFDFARSVTNDTEFCGACFSPDGRTLFVNQQGDRGDEDERESGESPIAVTYEIWGPFEDRAGVRDPDDDPPRRPRPPSNGGGAPVGDDAGRGGFASSRGGGSDRDLDVGAAAGTGTRGSAGGELPFTGLPVVTSAGAAALLTAGGAILRRRIQNARLADAAEAPDDA